MSSIPFESPVSEAPQGVLLGRAEPRHEEKASYGQILKSSALIGGSSVLNIGIGIVRTKAMAVLLGPAGFGLFGLYGSVADVTQSIAGMGINSSGVRQIAEAAGSNDTDRIARTALVLRRVSLLLGLLGAGLLVAFSGQISTLTFGDRKRAAAVSMLSIVVLCRLVSGGQAALIQGMRRIGDLAKMSVLGAAFGTLMTIPLVYFLREKGVVPSLIAVAGTTIVTSWWYSRKIRVDIPFIAASQLRQEAASLLTLGSAFMASGFMTIGVAYLIRITVLHKVGYEATGLYQSAWTLGGLYVGVILQAMGADFFPRLTASAHDNPRCNRLVNEQVRVGLLLAGPGVIATLTFAPIVLALFYSSKFSAAVDVLRWICLGVTLQVISWPMGYIIVAKGNKTLFFLAELIWAVFHLGLAWFCVSVFGLNGAGIAFFGSYVFHGCLIYLIVSRLSSFEWSAENRQTGLFFMIVVAAVFCGFYVLPFVLATCVGTLSALVCTGYSIRVLITLVSLARLPRPLRALASRLRVVPST